jgi:succinoglycan biosynthesis transport protein ExoP
MDYASSHHHGRAIHHYLALFRRRKWPILLAVFLLPGAALLFSLLQQPRYEARAETLLNQQNLATALATPGGSAPLISPERYIETQLQLARVPEVARQAAAAAEATGWDTGRLLANSKVTAVRNSDILSFSVTDEDPALAAKLATAYAREFTVYRRNLDTASLRRARTEVKQRIDALVSSGEERSPLARTLSSKEQQLATLEALQTSNAALVRGATSAGQTSPRTTLNVFLGVVLGLALGLGAALLWEALDTRLRTADDVQSLLGLTPLAALPPPPRDLAKQDELVMLASPDSIASEPFRILRTNVQFANLDRQARVILVTSAIAGEGKTTTAANLAIACARSGLRTILVDFDLRRPNIGHLLRLGSGGVTSVALGQLSLDEAYHVVDLEGTSEAARLGLNGHGSAGDARLRVLTSGPVPPSPGEFVASRAVADIFDNLRRDADVVIVDTAPMLPVSDTMTLSALADAILVIVRLNLARRPMMRELRTLLDASPARKLGVVIAGLAWGEAYGYRGYYGEADGGTSKKDATLEAPTGVRI